MSNWVIQNFIYNFNPSIYNYIKFKWYHFRFCQKDDPTISPALYLDNLGYEIEIELSKEITVNKRSLTLTSIRRILQIREARQKLILFFNEKKKDVGRGEIKDFLKEVAVLMNEGFIEEKGNEEVADIPDQPDFPARTYVIATHIYLEINHNELHYETLIRDSTALKEFIASKFKAGKISGRITDMKNFSYKKILSGKNSEGAKGQLKPQLRQIASNPLIFGKDVAAFADDILEARYGSNG